MEKISGYRIRSTGNGGALSSRNRPTLNNSIRENMGSGWLSGQWRISKRLHSLADQTTSSLQKVVSWQHFLMWKLVPVVRSDEQGQRGREKSSDITGLSEKKVKFFTPGSILAVDVRSHKRV